MEIGEKIRFARLAKGFSQENMADLLGISTTAYGDIERNKTELTISRAKKLANILKISILELLGEEIITPIVLENPTKNDVTDFQEELEKLKSESEFWREKFEQKVLTEAYRQFQGENQRGKIGF
jgi:XRE family transcriptional regulator, regulator of sulfur utilization